MGKAKSDRPAFYCVVNWPAKNEGSGWEGCKCHNSESGLVEDPVFSGDHAGRGENPGYSGRLNHWTHLFFKNQSV